MIIHQTQIETYLMEMMAIRFTALKADTKHSEAIFVFNYYYIIYFIHLFFQLFKTIDRVETC